MTDKSEDTRSTRKKKKKKKQKETETGKSQSRSKLLFVCVLKCAYRDLAISICISVCVSAYIFVSTYLWIDPCTPEVILYPVFSPVSVCCS